MKKKYPLVRACALRCLSVMYSTAAMERTLFIMRHMEQPHKLSTKDPPLRDEMFLRCNKHIVDALMKGALDNVTAPKGASSGLVLQLEA